MDQSRLFSVVLAAGNARRFGATKQLALLEGVPLVARAIETAESVCGADNLLVLGSDWQHILPVCQGMQGFVILNEDFASGMASSIRAAIRRLDTLAGRMLLLLADQPLVDPAHLLSLKRTSAKLPDKIVASAYAGVIGPPVIFPRRFFLELARLSGDQGARPMLARHPAHIITIDCEQAATDIDRPEDLASLQADLPGVE